MRKLLPVKAKEIGMTDIRLEEKEEKEEKKPKFDDRLLETRTILIYGQIDQKLARAVSRQLLLLAADSDEDIKIFINSQGGHVESGDTIFDMIRFVKPKVKIIGTGWVASAGALIFSAADKENRLCLPNTRFLLHQPSGGVMGQATDIGIEAKEIVKMRSRLNQIFVCKRSNRLWSGWKNHQFRNRSLRNLHTIILFKWRAPALHLCFSRYIPHLY